MPLQLWNLEWSSLNGARKYPLSDDASGVDTTGAFALPTDLLVGLTLPYDAALGCDPSRFYLSGLTSSPAGYRFEFSYDDPLRGAVAVGSVTAPRAGHSRNRAYALAGSGDFGSTRGHAVVGATDSADLLPPGSYSFAPAAGRLDPDVVSPQLRGLAGLYLVNGADVVGPLYGDVYLRAGTNFEVEYRGDGGVQTVVLHAVSGTGTVSDCACPGGEQAAPCVTNVNGVFGVGGALTLSGDRCTTFAAADGGLTASDACSSPCCSCAELEALTRDLAKLQQQQATADQFLRELSGSVRQMDAVVLGAKLGDRGCNACG